MAVEEGFIQYTVDVKNADRVRREFDELADAAVRTGKGFEQLDKHLAENEKRHGRVVARLRESVKALREYAEVSRKAESANAASTIDERKAAYEQERRQVSLLADELERMSKRRKLDQELSGNLKAANKATDVNENQKIANELGREAAARDRLTKAIEEQARAKKRLDEVGDPRKGSIDAARYQEANDALKQYTSATNEVTAAQRNMSAATQELDRGIISQRYALYDVSNTLMVVGGALSGVGIYATVVGAQFQSAFANVERTLDPAEFAAGELAGAVDSIRNSLVQLTGQMPLTFAELSEIATIGNQMGIAQEDLIDFTGTIARFASVSGMSIDEVTKAFGGFMAQTGLAPKYLENLGSSLAYVSIKSNATEAEILSVSREIAALSTGAGLSADQIVGLAGTLAALRVPAERSRGSLETYFGTLRRAVATGGQDLQNFATIVGVTANELESMVRAGRGAEVLEGFLLGLNDLDSVSVTQALDSLNLSQLRVSNTFTRMSQNVDTFRDHMSYAQSSFIQGAELNRQYEITLETVNAQWQIFINGINGLVDAISGGAMPTLASFMQAINGVLFWLIELLQRHKWAAYVLAFGAALVTVTGLMLVFRAMVLRGNAALLAYRVAAAQAGAAGFAASTGLRALISGLLGVEAGARRGAAGLVLFRQALVRTGVGALIVGAGFLADKLFGISSSANDATLSMAQYNDITAQAQRVSQGAGDGAGNLADKLGGGGGGSPSVAKAAEEAAQKIRLLTDYAQDLSGVLSRSFSIRFDSGAAMDQVITKWNKLREEAEKYQQEINKLTADRSLRAYWLSIAEMYDDQLRASQLRAEIADIDADLAKAQAGASRELEGNTQAAVDNRATMRDLLQGYQDYIEALAASGASQQFIQAEVRRLNGEFMSQATALGYNATELGAYSTAFKDMTTIVANVPREVTIDFNGDPALQALAEFRAKLEEEARQAGAAAGSGAGDAFGGGFDDSMGGFDFDDAFDPMMDSAEKAESFWDEFWWNVGHVAIRGIAAIVEPLWGANEAIKAFFSGQDVAEAWERGIAEAGVQVRDQFGAIGFMGAEAVGAEFKRGLKPGEWISNGVTYAWDPIAREMSRVGAMSAEEYNASLGAGVIPGPIIVDGINWAKDPITGEIYKVGVESAASWNSALLERLDPTIIQQKIAEGKPLSNQEAKTLAESMGLEYNSVLNSNADPIGQILNKIQSGKDLTANEAKSLAGANAADYNSRLGATLNIGGTVNGQFNSITSTSARNAGDRAGSGFWDGVSSWLNSIGNWISSIFNPSPSIGSRSGGRSGGGYGFSGGGYTGSGHWLQPAGVVHAKEYVIPHWGVDQRTKLPKLDYVQSLQRSKPAPRGMGGGFSGGGYTGTGGGGTIELGEYTIGRLGRQVTVGLMVDRQELASAASGGDARLARRGSN